MTTLSNKELRDGIDAALSEVMLAETALDHALGDLGDSSRSEKVLITAVVTEAFSRVKSARAELARLRTLL